MFDETDSVFNVKSVSSQVSSNIHYKIFNLPICKIPTVITETL